MIIENVKDTKKHDPEFKEIAEDNIAVMKYFEDTAKNSLHIVLAMSPIGDDFKRRLRMFPALVNKSKLRQLMQKCARSIGDAMLCCRQLLSLYKRRVRARKCR